MQGHAFVSISERDDRRRRLFRTAAIDADHGHFCRHLEGFHGQGRDLGLREKRGHSGMAFALFHHGFAQRFHRIAFGLPDSDGGQLHF